ncbi:MAG: DUF5939 domain-containing protein [Candidatus Sericytochromatia bacterium]
MTDRSPLREKAHVEALRQQARQVSLSTELDHSPEILWPLVSNTDMMNQKLGMAPTENAFRPTTYGGSQLSVVTKSAGMTLAYEEFPYEWVALHSLSVERIFQKGPLKYLKFGIRLEAISRPKGAGTRVTFEMDYVPGILGIVVKGILIMNLKQMVKVFQGYNDKLNQGDKGIQVFFESPEPALVKINRLIDNWQDFSSDKLLPQALATYLFAAPDRYASRIRPFDVAQLYDLPPLETLRFCLMATRAGLLHMRWDMRCPSCKGPKENSGHLSGVSAHAYCESCAVDYAIGFDQNLELTFFPDASLRPVNEAHFCAGSPANTPHLQFQANLWPRESREISVQLELGLYAFRSLATRGEQTIMVVPEGADVLHLELGDDFSEETILVAPRFTLGVKNPKNYFQTLQLENLEWSSEVCTGALVSSMQEFRDFFSQELLAEDTSLPISRQTFLLAHLSHQGQPLADTGYLDLIGDAVREHDGAEVRCQDQTVLATFQDALDALKTAMAVSQHLLEVNHYLTPEQPLSLQISFHEGPCSAISRNGSLDYSGEAVDAVYALQRAAQPDSIVVSEQVLADADFKWLLLQQQLQVQRLAAAEDNPELAKLKPYHIERAPLAVKGGL